VVLGFIATVVY